ncbi:O-antigen ligase family protein [Rhodopirellula sallentina]|uniref:Hemocyanin type 1 n=1 Tax=Rhodopirellula sallentina SM41 TaxID=1263870 RepID=M5UB13_9BACT|nr:O-antigen ligase family protein [Rhodopirellula sallentina]EMI55036.1 hemocyanin type 1 [Rhodopirellula sallentina SM41]
MTGRKAASKGSGRSSRESKAAGANDSHANVATDKPLRRERYERLAVAKSAVFGGLCAGLVWASYYPADSTAVEQGDALGLSLGLMVWAACSVWAFGFSSVVASARVGWSSSSWWLDAAPVLLAAWVTVAGWVGTGYLTSWSPSVGGDVRAATNEVWWWVADVACFVIARRLFANHARSVVAVGVVMGAGALLASHTLHQYFISFPQTIREYESDPEGMLAKIGLDAEAGSAARMIFENRMRDGGPTGTFALANSLAGPLAISLVLAMGALIGVLANRKAYDTHGDGAGSVGSLPGVMLGLLSGLLAVALFTTGSRSGVLSVVVVGGVGALVWLMRRKLFRRSESTGAEIVNEPATQSPGAGKGNFRVWSGVLAVLSIAAFGILWRFGHGILGGEWVSQAPATIQLRLQYWRSTLAMAADYPVFAARPGNFQIVYQKYRDILAHELIAEPHNFFFETLACGGWGAAGLLVVWIGVSIRATWKGVNAEAQHPEGARRVSMGSIRSSVIAAALGAFVSFVGVWYHGIVAGDLPDFDAHLIAVPIAVSVLAVWLVSVAGTGIVLTPMQCRMVASASVATGMLHLCFSGGWTVPGVSMFLLTLAAIATSPADERSTDEEDGSTSLLSSRMVVSGLLLGLALVCYWFSYRPVSRSEQAIVQANMLASTNRRPAASAMLRDALSIDPLNADAAMWLAGLDNQALLVSMGRGQTESRSRRIADESIREAVRRSGNDPTRLRAVSELMLQRYQVGGNRADIVEAAELLSRARELSPTHESITAQYAEVLRELERLGVDGADGVDSSDGADIGGESAAEMADRAEMLAESGGVITRVLRLQRILPARVIGAPAVGQPVRAPADEVLAGK